MAWLVQNAVSYGPRRRWLGTGYLLRLLSRCATVDRVSFMRPLFHRLIAALLVLAFATPATALCGQARAADAAMARMSCCRKLSPARTGSVERDCCRINQRLPEPIPAAPLPARALLNADTTLALVALPVTLVADGNRGHRDLQTARGRPHGPTHFLSSVLLI